MKLDEPHRVFGLSPDERFDIELGRNEYLLLGDNSQESLDGREWGATRKSSILGRMILRIFPIDSVRTF